jgi:hypothetical protein
LFEDFRTPRAAVVAIMSDMIFRYRREYRLEQGRAVGSPMSARPPEKLQATILHHDPKADLLGVAKVGQTERCST